MSSLVFFAAMIPAIRAAAITSPFLRLAVAHQCDGLRRDAQQTAGDRAAIGIGLVADVDHARGAFVVEMGELLHE